VVLAVTGIQIAFRLQQVAARWFSVTAIPSSITGLFSAQRAKRGLVLAMSYGFS
jgi:hypothetical protein